MDNASGQNPPAGGQQLAGMMGQPGQTLPPGVQLAYVPATTAGGAPQLVGIQQQPGQPQQFVFGQQYVLQGKPMLVQAQPAGSGQPQLVGLPGGTYIQPHVSLQPQGAPAGSGYPQLVGLPAGYQLAPTASASTGGAVPTIVAQPAAAGTVQIPMYPGPPLAVQVKQEVSGEDRPSSSHSANTSAGGLGSDGSPHVAAGSGGTPGSAGGNKSRYRGVSYDRKKAKWRVQIKVAALGKSGVSVGYFDTEEAAARAYDRAAIGLLGRDNPNLQTNFDLADYAEEPIPRLTGKTREEVKTTLKSERIKQAPRRRFTSRQRTSRFMGVGSSNRKNQWQARILVHGKVTHLGYYETEEDAARVYDRVSLALHGDHAQTNFPSTDYSEQEVAPYRGLDREDLQRALGVKPMDKSSRFRGVSKKKGKWEAKVMVNRRWAYRELFDSEEEAARAYDRALWRLKPREARSYVNFKDEIPADAEALAHAAAAAGDYRGAASDGDLVDSDGGFGGAGGEDDDYSDGGDFEYEYKPTKGTRRSASMRAKRAGSMPNLAAAAAGGSGRNNHKQQAAAAAAAAQAAPEAAGAATGNAAAVGGPAFVTLPGGGLQLQFDSFGGGLLPSTSAHMEEPLLIRVGSETHVLPSSGPSPLPQILGKRTGLQRIQSEPQFNVSKAHSGDAFDLSAVVPGTNAGDINDLMNDKELFKGLDLAELAGGSGAAPGNSSGTGLDLHSLGLDFMHTEGDRDGHGGLAGMFEDDEIALANLELTRPRKIPKSMSMNHLSSLAGASDEAPLPAMGSGIGLEQHKHGAIDPMGRPPLPSRRSPPASGSTEPQIGPLGQPIRRVNTFTASLPSFEEAPEGGQDYGTGLDLSGHDAANNHQQMKDADDLVSQFLDPMPQMPSPLEDALQMLGDS